MTEAEKLQLCLERDRLLCSAEFARAPTMIKLLRFLVDHKLSEETTPLTAYAVAVDGLGRDDSFDTQIDSYPRVQIGRLRRMLDHFYLREKSEKRLFIPYQHYEIILGPNEIAGDTAQPIATSPAAREAFMSRSTDENGSTGRLVGSTPRISPGYIISAFGILLLLVAGLSYYLLSSDGEPATEAATSIAYPAIIVEETEGVDNPSSRAKIELAHSNLIGALGKFDQIRIFDGTAGTASPSQYILESSILNNQADSVQLRLVASDTREVIWSSKIDMTTATNGEAELNKAVIDIASSYGKIAQHELTKYRDDYAPGYPCLLQFHQYLRYREPSNLEPVLSCMDSSARQFPNDAYLMSMLAIAKNIAEQFGVENKIEGSGKDFALKAAKLDNNSASATFAVAQSAFFEGDCHKGVSWGERAVRLNPLNSRIVGYLGIYMAACQMPEAKTYATRALEMDPNADLAIAAMVALQKLRSGDVREAQQLSAKYADSVPGAAFGLEISYILSSAMLGEKEEAREAWRLLAERSGLPETAAPRDVLRKSIGNPAILRQLESDFEKAELY